MAKHSTPQVPSHPLGRIALCMSGGGYRAAVFQLGILSYLNAVYLGKNPLIEKVKAISTVSGGTITGVFYAAMKAHKIEFKTIYNTLIDWLHEKDLVQEGLEKVGGNTIWTHPYKRRNLINAFAEIYDHSLTQGMKLGALDGIWDKSHLEFLCFNATEFKTGLRYRFQMAKGQRQSYVGAPGINLKKKFYHHIRLGDIIASSSAFSGGFEPMAMPDDFFAPNSGHRPYFESHSGYKGNPIGLMDGGIYDNQGISSIEHYQDNDPSHTFDLIMICDVSSPYLEAFEFVSEKKGGLREKTLNSILASWKQKRRWLYLGLWLLTLLGASLILWDLKYLSWPFGMGIAIFTIAVGTLVLYHTLKSQISKKLKKTKKYIQDQIPDFFEQRIPFFKLEQMPLKYLETLALDRFNSLKLLLPTIFLKQIRRLHYNRIYKDPAYEYRRLTCLVKELTQVDFKKKIEEDYDKVSQNLSILKTKNYTEIMGEKLIPHMERAATFGTTLWFTDTDKLDQVLTSLIICGQVTCCQNLMIYLDKIIHTRGNGYAKLDATTKKQLIALYEITKKNWLEFRENPTFLHESLLK